jgi:signal transduction histidine kinase
MKFTLKVFLCTITVIAVALGFGGIYLVNTLFNQAIQRETRQAMDENAILRISFETIALNVPVKYDRLEDTTIREIASSLSTGRSIRISEEDSQALFASEGLDEMDNSLLEAITDTTQAYRIIKAQDRYFINTATSANAMGRMLYLETYKDISSIFDDRDTGFQLYRNITLLALLIGTIIMSFFSFWLTRPIRLLSRASKSMASGDYHIRAKRVSNDEFGLLTDDFNTMADGLQLHMTELQEAAKSRERFVAAFAHELKTPLTSIVGYADLLRSRKLGEEKTFMSANYIFTEGKRLEKLSLRLLDIFVLKNRALDPRITPVIEIFTVLGETFPSERGVVIEYEEATLNVEIGLLIATLDNLIDNAIKASEPYARIEVAGRITDDGYRFSVRDFGCGIPPDKIDKLTQAFYMVDKSRSRSEHGVGLGLTLCAGILALHDSMLEFESTPGEGTEVSFLIKL